MAAMEMAVPVEIAVATGMAAAVQVTQVEAILTTEARAKAIDVKLRIAVRAATVTVVVGTEMEIVRKLIMKWITNLKGKKTTTKIKRSKYELQNVKFAQRGLSP
ncbi:hypothetical protein ZHAS_00014469 [Anopheles sinensis]|uniref:Uncharacterized protein n=1 Tax=Anopheles sinensis TaxID=74873 RepID=A0A084W8D8_ANOSI|nr:hypothetical protein ZHAS_00014469 [Anopheles sinensis]